MAYHAQYRQLWIDQGYRGFEASCCAVKPPPKEYRAAYHFVSAESARSDIRDRCIKATRISEANDPFEFEGLKATGSPHRAEIANLKNNTLVLCFSKDWRSPALWAHYADRHRGLCLGFWAKRETLQEVVYPDHRLDKDPAAKTSNAALTLETKNLLMRTKPSDWSYEEEIRRFVTSDETFENDGKLFFRFDDTLILSEVILGYKCPIGLDIIRAEVRNLYPQVAVFKSRPAWNYFTMVPVEASIP